MTHYNLVEMIINKQQVSDVLCSELPVQLSNQKHTMLAGLQRLKYQCRHVQPAHITCSS